ncbi:hypothetical protein SCHPADRAFT_946306 [Schizopora paradoxa]|uniref:Uncharacterized protein n=1 Tax=Schizopora paradoxa TaxID=27342 RepID=A0A0H2R4C3_9AGAM|nr:hypothetical protein SCHPADRAFT_946306 [Schizopora paradoxa]
MNEQSTYIFQRISSFPLAISGIFLGADNNDPVPVSVRAKISGNGSDVIDLLFDRYIVGDLRTVTVEATFPDAETLILTAFISTAEGELYDKNKALSNFVGTEKRMGDVLLLKHRPEGRKRFQSISAAEWNLIRMVMTDHEHLL